ncbi:MAG: hypothetical protein K9W44_00755 [Candidatus Lokiarchaeota archaeon]|nr:hypothetical protein [Candidatus Harpocratesius repetitus]
MSQLNIRINKEDRAIISLIAKNKGISVAELVRSVLMKEILADKVNILLNLVAEGKLSRKKAFQLSGLTYHEFLNEWTKRNIEEVIPEEAWNRGLELALNLDSTSFLKKNR